jgi:hypothetical protein
MYGLSAASFGAAGFGAYKTVQLSTGGSVEAKFTSSDISAENKMALSTMKGFAIWPVEKSLAPVYVAEMLENNGYTVVTPTRVTSAATKLGISTALQNMTPKERQHAYRELCNMEAVDATISPIPLGQSTNANVFSFNRADTTHKAQIDIYSREKDKIVWSETLHTSIKYGSRIPDEEEISKAVASVVAEKIFEITGKAERRVAATNN